MKSVPDALDNSFYVVSRGGKYLTESGSDHMWTSKLENARHFATLKEASDECCENEYPKGI